MQVRLFYLSMDKQILKKHLSCDVKHLVGQVGHAISTGLLKAFVQSLVQIGTVVSEKIQFLNFRMYMTLGQGQEMTFTFNTHLPS